MTCRDTCKCGRCKICYSCKGEPGDKGDKGPKGATGEDGLKGNKGPRGNRGDKGQTGPKGDRGDMGPIGDMGPDGPRGPMGDAGNKGPKGNTGDKGNRGPKGNRGLQGDPGLPGDKGDTGDKGPVGDVGPIGPIGPIGPPGVAGDNGEIGPKGDTGDKGPQGEPGFNGIKGDVGPAGPIGDKGDSGGKGYIGPPGGTIAPPSEVILAKIASLAQDTQNETYVTLDTPILVDESSVGLQNREIISNVNLSYIEMETDNMISIKNIESFNVVFLNQGEKDNFINEAKGIFTSFYDCSKSAPETVAINGEGETESTGDLNFDFEYTTNCSCNGICQCTGNRVDICKYLSSKTEGLRKAVEKARNNGKKIEKIITLKPNFLDERKLISDIEIEAVSSGGVLLSYNMNDNGVFLIVSVVPMDKIMAIKFK